MSKPEISLSSLTELGGKSLRNQSITTPSRRMSWSLILWCFCPVWKSPPLLPLCSQLIIAISSSFLIFTITLYKRDGHTFYIGRCFGPSKNYVGYFCCKKLLHCFCICTSESIILSCSEVKYFDELIQKVLFFFHPKFFEEPLAQSSIPCRINLIPIHTFCEETLNAFIQDWLYGVASSLY